MSSGTLYGRFQDVIGTNLRSAENGRFWEAATCSAIHVNPPTTGIGPRMVIRHHRDLNRLETSAAPNGVGSRSRLVPHAPGSSPPHQAVRSCDISADTLPSLPAMPVKHTARHRLMRGPPTPGDHRHRDRRSEPPSGARCVSVSLRHPDRPHRSADRRGAVRARSDHGAGRQRLVASGQPILIGRGLDGVLVLYPLFFCKCVGGQLIRKRRDNRPAGVAAPYLKPRPVLGDDVCAHALSMAWTKPGPKRDRLRIIQCHPN
jgi:hypothetical protein